MKKLGDRWGTEWPVPADLSALDPVCLNKRKRGEGEGVFGF